jgi:F-box protein 9
VHEAYKRKHFPPSSFPPAKATASSSSNAGSRSDQQPQHAPTSEPLPSTLKQLLEEFSTLRIEPVEPPTSASPPEKCPIAALPEEIVTHIISDLAVADVTSLSRLSQVCKRLAFLVLTEESIWKRVAMESSSGFLSMHYDYAVDLHGQPIDEYDDDDDDNTTTTPHSRTLTITLITDQLLHTHYASSWRQLFRTRPRIRFNGCYISTVNYTRAGAASTNSLTWGVPIHIVTYFRYLRFFRDGACVSLLTTAEPADVVHHLTRANLLRHRPHQQQHQQQQHATSALPSAVMRDALRGRWRLSGPASSSSSSSARAAAATAAVGDHAPEPEGDLFVETEGVVPKYTYKMHLGLAHAGKGARNNKLAWKGFWSHNKLTDDWAEFGLRNDRGFYWSRVKSYGVGE